MMSLEHAAMQAVARTPFGLGLLCGMANWPQSLNPYPIETADWRQFLDGFHVWQTLPEDAALVLQVEVLEEDEAPPTLN